LGNHETRVGRKQSVIEASKKFNNNNKTYIINYILYIICHTYRNKDREIEDIEEKHQEEIKVYKQKLKLLMYEQHVHLSEVQVSCICFMLFRFCIGIKIIDK